MTIRTIVSLVIAPGIPALCIYLAGLFFVTDWEAAWAPKILAVIAYFATISLGIPTYYFLQQKGASDFIHYLISGVVIGVIFYILFIGIWVISAWYGSGPQHSLLILKNSIPTCIMSVSYAALSSAIFWLIAVWEPKS